MLWRKKVNDKVELTESGFLITCDEDISEFNWNEIDKLIGFKIDRFTIDGICLKIESEDKIAFITEESEGWRNFMNELLKIFPEIEKIGKLL